MRSWKIAFPKGMEIETKQEQDAFDDPDEDAEEAEENAEATRSNVPLDAQDDDNDDMKAIGPRQKPKQRRRASSSTLSRW